MGLAERRAIKEFQDKNMPTLQQKIDAAAGFAVPIEVDWDSLAVEGKTNLYEECWPKVYFEPMVKAFEKIAADDMGREALKNSLKTVRVSSGGQTQGVSGWARFSAGVLTLDHKSISNIGEVEQRTKVLVKALENGL